MRPLDTRPRGMRSRPLARRLAALVLIPLVLTGCASTGSVTRGEALREDGKWDDAVAEYLEVLKREPSSIEGRIGLARSLAGASDFHAKRGQGLEAAGRHAEALAAYQRALTFNVENVRAREGARRMGDLVKAQELLARGRELLAARSHREAARTLLDARRLDPANSEIAQALEAATTELKAAIEVARREREQEQARAALTLFPTQPVNLRFRDTDLREVLDVFGKLAAVNVFLDESLAPRKVTTAFQDLSLREAFRLVLETNRLFARRAGDRTMVVAPDTPAKRQQYEELVVQTFYLNDADARVAVNLLRTILNTKQIYVNEKLNALVVRETPEKLEMARKLLDANDRGPGEVEIQLEVLEVNRSRLENLGVHLKDESFTFTIALPYRNIRFGDIGKVAGTETITVSPDPTIILNLARSDADTKTLASPTVRVLDRQKARVLIGERRPFQVSSIISSTAASTTTPGTAGTVQETRVEFRDVGLKLSLTPAIHPTGEVTVELAFEISSVGAPIPGVSNGALLVPINTRNLDTFIKLRDGETRLLGGLIQDIATRGWRRIPILGDLPLIGWLFSNRETSKTRTDVLIAITPRIVKAMERPRPEVEAFPSGTAEGFGGEGAVVTPVPVEPSDVVPLPAPPPPGAPKVPE